MRAIVISDLHAITRKDPDRPLPSLIEFSNTSRSSKQDPLLGLQDLLNHNKLGSLDVLICAGDLGDKADANAIRTVWGDLNTLAAKASIPLVFATCGNHDLDTRYSENKFDPKGFLRALDPPFPSPSIARDDPNQLRYWADNFSIVEGDTWRILNINSCAYHGYGEKGSPEIDHGRISDFTLENIKRQLLEISATAHAKFNICVFHHHLREVSSDRYTDTSKMSGAENLIELLSEAKFGEWLVVHGHKHRAAIYQASGITSPIVLSCASFSATPVGDEHNPSPNQFYVIELEPPSSGKFRMRGVVNAWNWAPSYGWLEPDNAPGGLPRQSGFGFKGDLHEVAERVVELILRDGRLPWDKAMAHFPELRHFLPHDLKNLVQLLESEEQLTISYEGRTIREVVRR